jgi:protein-L-isoaspartate(D-aspartate) O-methyltransferase
VNTLRTLSKVLTGAWAALAVAGTSVVAQDHADARRRMVTNIEQLSAAGAGGGAGRFDPAVLRIMREVPRHLFVPEEVRARAYHDGALPLGHDSTISQPFVVAWMTDALEVRPEHTVLEVGTGSGYQAAVLSPLVRRVYSIEIVEPLAHAAAERLKSMGYANVTVRAGDGYAGWPEHAPFDRIIVTAGATHIPAPLVRQLKPGGRMVIPVGRTSLRQQLTLVQKDARGRVWTRQLGPVSFIPLEESAARR